MKNPFRKLVDFMLATPAEDDGHARYQICRDGNGTFVVQEWDRRFGYLDLINHLYSEPKPHSFSTLEDAERFVGDLLADETERAASLVRTPVKKIG